MRPDPSRHLPREALDAALEALPAAPATRGTVKLLVARPATDERQTPAEVQLHPDRPLPGDRWSAAKDPARASQLTAMEWAVGVPIANGQPLGLFGDNLVLDLDLGAPNLPAGSRVRVGEALLEVTSEPHTGCKKYAARFGVAALAWISRPDRKPRRLRGVHFRVLEGGRVRVGDDATVEHRPQDGELPSPLSDR